jgi:hypothetical protein
MVEILVNSEQLRFDLNNVRDITIRLKAKDGTWSRSWTGPARHIEAKVKSFREKIAWDLEEENDGPGLIQERIK